MTTGTQIIEFASATGYTTPSDTNVTIAKDAVTETSIAYAAVPVADKGSLKITITPAGAVTAGAKWRLKNTTEWKDSGVMVADILAGVQVVEFASVSGFTAPADINVMITKDMTTEHSVSYIAVNPPTPESPDVVLSASILGATKRKV